MNFRILPQQSSWMWEHQMKFQFQFQFHQSSWERQMNFQISLLQQSGQELQLWSLIPTIFRHPYLQRQWECPLQWTIQMHFRRYF